MKSIVLDPGIKDLLLDDAKDFLQSEEWYAERGIPFRRGYLLVRLQAITFAFRTFADFFIDSMVLRDRERLP